MTKSRSPRFSVITVTRNDLPGLRRTWASLATQTFGNFEWVVVDGASTDGTAEWLGSLVDPRVKWISEPDCGIYDAMNKGLRIAEGALLQFLNASDCLASIDVLELVDRDQHERRWSWAFGIERFLNAQGGLADVYTGMPFRRRLLELGYRYVPHPPSFFTRDLAAQLEGYDLRYPVAADQDFIMRAARLATPAQLREVLVHFAFGGVSTTQAPDSFVWQTHQIRRDRGWLLAGSRTADLLVSWMLAQVFRLRAMLAPGPWDRPAEAIPGSAEARQLAMDWK